LGAARRDSLTLLRLLLEALMEHAKLRGSGVSKTRIVSATGLNPYSFNNYIMQARRSGGVLFRTETGRTYYEPTYRTALITWALGLVANILEPPRSVLEKYEELLRNLEERLVDAGVMLRKCLGGEECSIPSDAILECRGRLHKLYVAVEGDPLNDIRALALLESVSHGEETLLLLEPACRDSLIGVLASSLGIDSYSDVESLAASVAARCAG